MCRGLLGSSPPTPTESAPQVPEVGVLGQAGLGLPMQLAQVGAFAGPQACSASCGALQEEGSQGRGTEVPEKEGSFQGGWRREQGTPQRTQDTSEFCLLFWQ